jgi:hypothetical protein
LVGPVSASLACHIVKAQVRIFNALAGLLKHWCRAGSSGRSTDASGLMAAISVSISSVQQDRKAEVDPSRPGEDAIAEQLTLIETCRRVRPALWDEKSQRLISFGDLRRQGGALTRKPRKRASHVRSTKQQTGSLVAALGADLPRRNGPLRPALRVGQESTSARDRMSPQDYRIAMTCPRHGKNGVG